MSTRHYNWIPAFAGMTPNIRESRSALCNGRSYTALTRSSTIFFASPKTIIVLSM